MVDAGILNEDEHVQLIEGEILQMTPQYPPHAAAITLVARALARLFEDTAVVRVQLPLALSDASEPEPDVAVVLGDIRDRVDSHPATAALVVEVADSSLVFDRRRKAAVYARAGIADYWLVNLIDRVIEIYRQPEAGEDAGYREARVVGVEGLVSPLARPDARIAVRDLLP